jgi:predicted  nucleic acid-binding Zn-ribbon protein
MSDARALSDKLKQVQEELRQTRSQLDALRTQHAREQEALHKALEETRKEAARLRERIEKAEARRR